MLTRRSFFAALAMAAATPAAAQYATGQTNPFAFGGNGRVQPPPPTPRQHYGPPRGYGYGHGGYGHGGFADDGYRGRRYGRDFDGGRSRRFQSERF